MPLNPERLKARRKEMRYSQRGLSKAAGQPPWTVENMERGGTEDPKYTVITSIARVLGVDPDFFFSPDAVNNQAAS